MIYEDRRKLLLSVGITVAERDGYMNVNRQSIAEKANVSGGLVNSHFRNKKILQDEVFAEAIRTENFIILAQAFLVNSRRLEAIEQKLKDKIADHISARVNRMKRVDNGVI